jgi:hypothetical protein
MTVSGKDKDKFAALQELVVGGERSADFFRIHGWDSAADELVQLDFVERVGEIYRATKKGEEFFRRIQHSPQDARITFPLL